MKKNNNSPECSNSGGNPDEAVPTSYREKLVQVSKHVYFPTWFEETENCPTEPEEMQSSEEEEIIPNICFSDTELVKMRSSWKKSIIIQTVNYKKPIPDIA